MNGWRKWGKLNGRGFFGFGITREQVRVCSDESWDGESWLVTKWRVMFGPWVWVKEWSEK